MSKKEALEMISIAQDALKRALEAVFALGDGPVDRWALALLDIEDTPPTGAWGMSDETARGQLGAHGPSGIEGSRKMARIDAAVVVPRTYWSDLGRAAHRFVIPPAVFAAIASRESHHGRALDKNGYGDHGNAFGVFQVDQRHHVIRGKHSPYSLEHMEQAAEILDDYRYQIGTAHPDWPDSYVLKAMCCAYNSGVSNVRTVPRMDRGTTGNDYGADVLARAKEYLTILDEI